MDAGASVKGAETAELDDEHSFQRRLSRLLLPMAKEASPARRPSLLVFVRGERERGPRSNARSSRAKARAPRETRRPCGACWAWSRA